MSLRTLTLTLAATCLSIFFVSSTPAAPASFGGGSVGTLPSSSNASPTPKGERVKPGETKENEDGVKVKNPKKPDSKGDAYLDPKPGEEQEGDVESTVTCRPKSKPEITGLDATDKVIVNRNADATVTGTGGTVTLQSGGRVTVTAEKGGGPITINPSAGPSTVVHPGSTVTVG